MAMQSREKTRLVPDHVMRSIMLMTITGKLP